jgi:murein DD-endopeptidase MepM/ murein hydrolase activator NlpD
MVVSLAAAGLLAWDRFGQPPFEIMARGSAQPRAEEAVDAQKQSSPLDAAQLAPLDPEPVAYLSGIGRKTLLDTTIPTRPRVDVITYTVQTGDSVFSIADKFGLKPETILWGNFETLNDNPHLLSKDQELTILPTNGTYYQWQEGDTINQVASFFEVQPEDILNYPGNDIDLTQTDGDSIAIAPGTWVIVPGGKRALKDWGPPAISRANPASARYYGPGYCGAIYEGAIGTGTFVWPTPSHWISGYNYSSSVHPAIDIGGDTGNAIFATDNGVVVYAGWSNYGYGNLIVIDHGNGWQSAYAHLSAVSVGCGQSVFQGTYIGAMGSTGNSSGPHLHFELVYNGAKPNPLDYLP